MSASLTQRLIGRMSAMARYVVLVRQFSEIEKVVAALEHEQQIQMFALLDRELHRPSERVPFTSSALSSDYASQTSAAFARVRTGNIHIRLRSIVLWIATAWHETERSSHGDFQDMHRRLARSLRLMRAPLAGAQTAA